MLDLSQKPTENDNDLIPDGQLAWVYFKLREVKMASTGTRMLDVELTIDAGQPYAKRKIWVNIMDPTYPSNSDGAKNMGLMQLRRIMETAMGATPDNDASYQQLQSFEQLNGARVPIMIKIEKSKDPRYDDKNVPEFLSPFSSVKSVVKAYDLLMEGKHNAKGEQPPAATQAPAPGGFGQAPAAAAAQPAPAPAQPQPAAPAGDTPATDADIPW